MGTRIQFSGLQLDCTAAARAATVRSNRRTINMFAIGILIIILLSLSRVDGCTVDLKCSTFKECKGLIATNKGCSVDWAASVWYVSIESKLWFNPCYSPRPVERDHALLMNVLT